MTSVGSVSIDLSLNRTQFDRDIATLSKTSVSYLTVGLKLDRTNFDKDLRSLQNIQLTPLNLDVKLNPQSLQRQLRDLHNGAPSAIAIDLTANIRGFERQIRNLSKSIRSIDVDINLNRTQLQQELKAISKTDIECIDICLHPDIEGFRKKLEGIYKLDIDCLPIDLCPDLKGFDSKVRKATSKKYSTDIGLNTRGFSSNIEDAFIDALKRVQGKGIFSSISGLLTSPLKLVVSGIAPLFVGLGAAIAFPLGRQIGSGLASGLQSKFAHVIGSFELVGDTAGRVIGDGIEAGFSKGLNAAKSNANQIVRILEQTLGKERLTELFGAGYKKAITSSIQKAAPGKAITKVLGQDDVLIEQASAAASNNQLRLKKRSAATSQLEVQQKTADAILPRLKQKASALDAETAQFSAGYANGINNLTREELAQFQSIAKSLAVRRTALHSQIAEIEAKRQQAATGLATLGTAKPVAAPIPNLPKLYTDIAQQVASLSGIQKLDPNLIPKLNVSNQLRTGAFGNYDPKSNQINVSKEAYEALQGAKSDFQAIETLVHELRHALQFGFGQLDVDTIDKAGIKPLAPTPHEVAKLGRRVEQSVEIQPNGKQSIARSLETDAYVFTERNAASIAKNLAKSSAIKGFESNLGLGGSKADLQLKRAQTAELKKIQQINQLAASYGIDLQTEIASALGQFSQIESKITPLLQKARNIEALPSNEILAVQKEIELELTTALGDIARQSSVIKNALISKKQVNVIEEPVLPSKDLQSRVNQLTKPQLNKVAKNLGISASGKKVDALRGEILKANSQELNRALPTAIQEISANVKQQADTLSKSSLDVLRTRSREVSNIIKQSQSKVATASGTEKTIALKELLDGLEKERQLLKETLTRELDENVRNYLKSRVAILGKAIRPAAVEYARVIGATSNAKPLRRPLSQLTGNGGGFNSLASFEDINESLENAKNQLQEIERRREVQASLPPLPNFRASAKTPSELEQERRLMVAASLPPLPKRLFGRSQTVQQLGGRYESPAPLPALLPSEQSSSQILGANGLPLYQPTTGKTFKIVRAVDSTDALPKILDARGNPVNQEKELKTPLLITREVAHVANTLSLPENNLEEPSKKAGELLGSNGKPINQNIEYKPILGTDGKPLYAKPVTTNILGVNGSPLSSKSSRLTERSPVNILGANGEPLNSKPTPVNILGADGKPFTPIDQIENDLNALKRQELYRKAEIEEDLVRLREGVHSGRLIKPKKQPANNSSNEIKQLEDLLKSVDEALSGVDKEIASQVKEVIGQAQESVEAIKKLNNTSSRKVRKSTKKTDEALKQLEDKTNTEVATIESELETKREKELRRLENKLQRRYGLERSTSAAPQADNSINAKTEVKSIVGAIGGVFKGISTSRFNAAKKQSEQLAQQAQILLIDIESTIAIGKAAEAEARVLQKNIAANEKKVDGLLNQIKKANSGKSPKLTQGDLQRLSGQVTDLNNQIDVDKEAVAAANLRATKGRELQPFAQQIKNKTEAIADETDVSQVVALNKELKEIFKALGQSPPTNFFSFLDEGITSLIPKIAGLVKGFIAFQGVMLIQNALNSFARGAIDAAVKADKLQTALQFASGSEISGTRNLEFVRSEVERLKIPLAASIEGFTKLAAATKGTALAGKTTKDIFTGISEASTVLSLSADETGGALLALTQIASKGKVQAEELRGQLGERIPGAMSLAARAMGVTETQFNKLLDSGQVLAQDFLPRFAKQLHLEFGGAAVEASGNAQSAIFGVQNAFLSLQESAGKELLPGFTAGLNALEGILKGVESVMGEIILATTALSIALLIKLGAALKETIANLILTKATGATLGGAFSDIANYINNSATIKITAGIFVVIEAVKLLNDTINTDLVKSFKNAADSAERAAIASKKALTSKPQDGNRDKDNLPDINFVDTLTKGYARGDILTKVAANAYLAGAPAIGELLNRGAGFLKTGKFDYYSYAELQRDNLISNLGDFNVGNNQLIFNAQNSLQRLKTTGGTGGIDNQLKQVESDRAILQASLDRKFSRKGLLIPPEYQKQVEETGAKIEKLNDQKAKLTQPVTEDLLRVTNQIAATKSQIQALEDPKTIAALGGQVEANKQNRFLQNTLEALIKFKYNAEQAISSLKVDPVLTFTEAITKLNIELAKNQEATQKAFLTQKAQISTDSVASFSTDKILSDTTALKNALVELDKAKSDLAASEKDFKGKSDAITAPEFGKTLQKFDLTPNSSVAEISGKIDIAEDADKKTLELIKQARESESRVLEVRTGAADAEQKLQQARQSAALNSLQRYSDETLALSKRTENQQNSSLKLALHTRAISEEEGAVRSAAISAQSLARQKDVVDTQLNLLRSYYASGVVGAEEFNKRERELLNQQSDFKRQLVEQEINTREAQYKQILDLTEQANQKVEGAIALNLTMRNTDAKKLQLQLLNTQGDQKAGELTVQGISIAADSEATQERINLIKVELEQVKFSEEQKYITAKEATAKRRQLLQQLADANQKRVDDELQQEKNYREQVIHLIEAQVQKQKNASDSAVNGIERQKDAQNLLNQSIERSQKLEQSRYDLRKAIADAAVTESQIQLDRVNAALETPGANKPELLQLRANIENDISQKKLDALRAEQKFQQQNLQLELQKQAIVAKTATFEAEIAKLKAQQGVIEANAALAKAYQNKDTLAIDAAKIGLEIATRQLELSDRQVVNARENLRIQSEIASNATQAQQIQQKAALDTAIAADNLRKQKPIPSTESKPESDISSSNSVDFGKESFNPTKTRTKQLDSFEQSKLKVFAPDTRGINTNVIDQSGSRGLNKLTSIEAFFKRQRGLDPSESDEQYFKRQLGLDKYKSVEDMFNQSLGITPNDLVEAAKPVEVKPQSNGFTNFTEGLKSANKNIEAKLDQLNKTMAAALASPRSLYVSSPQPVTDAASIYSDISRGMMLNAGLG